MGGGMYEEWSGGEVGVRRWGRRRRWHDLVTRWCMCWTSYKSQSSIHGIVQVVSARPLHFMSLNVFRLVEDSWRDKSSFPQPGTHERVNAPWVVRGGNREEMVYTLLFSLDGATTLFT